MNCNANWYAARTRFGQEFLAKRRLAEAGVEGHVLEFRGRCYVVVSLLHTLFAKAQVPRSYLE